MGIINAIKEITWLTGLVLLAMVAFNGPLNQNNGSHLAPNPAKTAETFQLNQSLDNLSVQIESGTVALFDHQEMQAPEAHIELEPKRAKIASNTTRSTLKIR